MTTTLVEAVAAETQAVLSPLNVDQYHRMTAAGLLTEGAPIELIDGLLVRKDRRDSQGDIRTVGTRHAAALTRLARKLNQQIPLNVGHSRAQQPIILTPHDEPEPDVSVALGDEDRYAVDHPGPDDLRLVVEVADSSLSFDLGRTQVLYWQGGIAEY